MQKFEYLVNGFKNCTHFILICTLKWPFSHLYRQLSHHDFITSPLLISTLFSIWVWVLHTFHRSIEDLLNLLIHFDKNTKTFFTPQEFLHLILTNWQRKFKIYTAQPGNLFLNSISVYKILNSNKIFQI